MSEDCTKKTFETKDLAQTRLNEIKDEGGRESTPRRVYKCGECNKFHLTSMTRNNHKNINKIKIKQKLQKFNNFLKSETEYWENKFKDYK